ncbi:MAG: ribosome small subunit-dependent GTPase A [Erysipelotrichaceae bacterium]|nr:ribosome small subunit-dependent GTPase A [Erysipelotrichaceae bacterium]MDD3809551.1 ribosome small subunit-dependent GTPase A [Erysipelotrichaceae bacterium]
MDSGRIIKALSGFYYVKSDSAGEIISCRARGKFRKDDIKPLVGDFVEFEHRDHSEGYINRIKDRENFLLRPPIANVDQALLVSSIKEPDFSSLLLDKFIILMEHNLIKPVICLSKADLGIDQDIQEIISSYQKAGYEVIPFSSKDNMGIDKIAAILENKVSVITGQSGVGKSSLLNKLDPQLALQTNEISKALGRGKHTTRHVELMEVANGLVGDTPGFSSLELALTPQEMAIACHDFHTLASKCKFRGCLHDQEPGCAIKQAVEQGEIARFRYENYLTLLQEARERDEKKYG